MFGGQNPTTTTPATGFSFGAAVTSSSGFAFGAPTTSTPAASGGFSFGGVNNAPTQKATTLGGFNFGPTTSQPATTAAPGFSFGGQSMAQPAPTGGFNFGGTPTATPSGGITFGGVQTAAAPAATVLPSAPPVFGTPQPTAPPAYGVATSGLAPTTAPTGSLGFTQQPGATGTVAGTAQAVAGFSFPGTKPATGGFAFKGTAASGTDILGMPAPGTVQPGLGVNPALLGTAPTGLGAAPTGLGAAPTGLGAVPTGLGAVPTGLRALPTGLGSLQTGLGSLPTGISSLQTGIGSLPTGISSLQTGIGSLQTGIGSFQTGLGTLTAVVTSVTTASLGFGVKPVVSFSTATSVTGIAGQTQKPIASIGGFSLAPTATPTPATTQAGFNLGLGLPSSIGSAGFGMTAPVAATGTPNLGLSSGIPTTTTVTVTSSGGLSLGGLGTSTAATGFSLGGFGAASTAATTTTASAVPSAIAGTKTMTYQQLEDSINKWQIELEEQEKIFLQQATQVNAWDRHVMENGEKIVTLNKDVERVKTDQQKLVHELDFIYAQQRELEEMLNPLEKTLDLLPPISYQQHADLEREHTYHLAEGLDAQLKRMGQDLKEIIDRLNSSSSKTDNQDPTQQITKILNAHMDSLLWIDRETVTLGRRVDNIGKQMDSQRKEQEKNFRMAYS